MVRSAGTTKANAYKGGTDYGTDAAAFEEIMRIAQEHTNLGGTSGTRTERVTKGGGPQAGCYVKALPKRLTGKAAEFAARVNPANRTPFEAINLPPGVLPPAALTILVSKYWGSEPEEFTVSFMEDVPAQLRARIVEHMNAWSERIGKSFAETSGTGLIRITLEDDGYWSYLGVDCALIPQDQPTMSLQDFSMSTPESEYRRVVRHETGHTLGFPHEHMRAELVARIDPEKAYDYFWETQGWDQATVDQQVLTPLDKTQILGTPPDQDSIMCYHLPGIITFDGMDITGGMDINETDYAFAEKLYPPASFGKGSGRGRKPAKAGAGRAAAGKAGGKRVARDWGEENDVDLSEYGPA